MIATMEFQPAGQATIDGNPAHRRPSYDLDTRGFGHLPHAVDDPVHATHWVPGAQPQLSVVHQAVQSGRGGRRATEEEDGKFEEADQLGVAEVAAHVGVEGLEQVHSEQRAEHPPPGELQQ